MAQSDATPPVPRGQRRPSLADDVISDDERAFWRSRSFEWDVSADGKKRVVKVQAEDGVIKLLKRLKNNDSVVDSCEHTALLVNTVEKNTMVIALSNGTYKIEFKMYADRCAFQQALRVCRDFGRERLPFFESVTVFAGTWNVGDSMPQKDLSTWLRANGEEHDVYIIAVQECEYTIPQVSGLISRSKHKLRGLSQMQNSDPVQRHFFSHVDDHLPDHVLLESHSLMTMRLAVFVRSSLRHAVSNVKVSTEATGIASVVGNKGGIGIQFNVYETSLCAIGSHLAAHQAEIAKRNADYLAILDGLKLGTTDQHEVLEEFDHIFWLGDLNYRIDLPRDEVVRLIENGDIRALSQADQLNREREKKNVFVGWHEGKIEFMPTYRFLRGTTEYDEALGRIPAWCDRVLWRNAPSRELHLEQRAYDAVTTVNTSDHQPVYAAFVLRALLPPPLLPKAAPLFDSAGGEGASGGDGSDDGEGDATPESGRRKLTGSKGGSPAVRKARKRDDKKKRAKEKKKKGVPDNFPTVRVVELRGVGLPAMDYNGYSDPYVRIWTQCQGHPRPVKTPMIARTLNPQWKDGDVPPIPLRDVHVRYLAAHSLSFSVWDYDYGSGDDEIGTARVSLAPALAQPGKVVKFSVTLTHDGKERGALCGGIMVDHDDADEAYSLRLRSQSAVLSSRRKFTFANMLESDWNTLFACGETVPLKHGQTLLERGVASERIFRVVSGHLQVIVNGYETATIRAGGVTGEMSFLGRSTTTATLVAGEPTVVRAVRTEVADAVLQENDTLRMRFYYNVAATIGTRLKKMNAHVKPQKLAPKQHMMLPDGSPQTLDAVRNDPKVYALFREYLRGRWALETAEFVEKNAEYRTVDDEEKRVEMAKRIFDTYVDDGSPKEVCLASSSGIDAIRLALTSGDRDLFAGVEEAVLTMWQSDGCPKFLRSKEFQEYNEASAASGTLLGAEANVVTDYAVKHHHKWGRLRVYADMLDFHVQVLGFEMRTSVPLVTVSDITRNGRMLTVSAVSGADTKKKNLQFKFKTEIKAGDAYRTTRSLLHALDAYKARRVSLPSIEAAGTSLSGVEAIACMDRRAQQDGELPLVKGEHIECTHSKMLHGHLWYNGRSNGNEGWFPSHYVDIVGEEQSTSGLPSNEDWLLLLKRAEKRTYAPGDVVVQEGEAVHEFYSVVTGKLGAYAGKEMVRVGGIFEGEVIGGITLILGGEASVSVVADTDVHLVCVAAIYLSDLLKDNPELACKFFKYLALINELRLRRLIDRRANQESVAQDDE